MGTRADYYVGHGSEAEWLGSSAFDGHPGWGTTGILQAASEAEFRAEVSKRISKRDGTTPDMGWPWPWEDSHTTDFAYSWHDGTVWISCFGRQWVAVRDIDAAYQTEKLFCDGWQEAVERLFASEDAPEMGADAFPNMKDRQNVTFGHRSGALVFGLK